MATREREVTVGLEKILYLAAVEPAFREALLRDREHAVAARGLELLASERAMLALATREQLETSIDALDTSEQSLERRRFLRAVAGAVTLAAGTVLTACGEETTQGIRPLESGGIRPDDLGPELHAAGGIRPDFDGPPEARPPEAGAGDLPRSDGGPADAKLPGDGKSSGDGKKPGD